MIRITGLPALFPLALIVAACAGIANAAPIKTSHVTAELVAQSQAAPAGSTVYIALHQKIIPGWHTYWRNPGDAGQPTSLAWTLPAGWNASEIVWPQPERFLSGP